MDITETPDRLQFVYKPIHIWIQSVVLIVAAFLLPSGASPFALRAAIALFCTGFAVARLLNQGDIVIGDFDRDKGRLRVQCSGLRGTRTTDYLLSQIASVSVKEQRYRQRRRSTYVYLVYLELLSEERFTPISNAFFDKAKACHFARTICDFLGLRPYSFEEYRSSGWFSW